MKTFLAENGIDLLPPPNDFNLERIELGEAQGGTIKLTKAESIQEGINRITICGGRPAGIKEVVLFIKKRETLTRTKDFFIVINNDKKKGLLITKAGKKLQARISNFQQENEKLVIPYCCKAS